MVSLSVWYQDKSGKSQVTRDLRLIDLDVTTWSVHAQAYDEGKGLNRRRCTILSCTQTKPDKRTSTHFRLVRAQRPRVARLPQPQYRLQYTGVVGEQRAGGEVALHQVARVRRPPARKDCATTEIYYSHSWLLRG